MPAPCWSLILDPRAIAFQPKPWVSQSRPESMRPPWLVHHLAAPGTNICCCSINLVSSLPSLQCGLHVCAPSNSVVAHAQAIVSRTGGLQTLTQLLANPEAETRCSGMWALANMVYMASPAVTAAVMQALPWTQFQALLQDSSPEVQVGPHRVWC